MALTRTAAKNKINKALRANTMGLYSDDSWYPVYRSFDVIRELGFDLDITDSRYEKSDNGNLVSKSWKFEVKFGKKSIFGIITAHGAGSVGDPLDRYDVSAYVS